MLYYFFIFPVIILILFFFAFIGFVVFVRWVLEQFRKK